MVTRIKDLKIVTVRFLTLKGRYSLYRYEELGLAVGAVVNNQFVGIKGPSIPIVQKDKNYRDILDSISEDEIYATDIYDVEVYNPDNRKLGHKRVSVETMNKIIEDLYNRGHQLISLNSRGLVTLEEFKEWQTLIKSIRKGQSVKHNTEIDMRQVIYFDNSTVSIIEGTSANVLTTVRGRDVLTGEEVEFTYEDEYVSYPEVPLFQTGNYDVLFYNKKDKNFKPSFEEMQKQAHILARQGIKPNELGPILADIFVPKVKQL